LLLSDKHYRIELRLDRYDPEYFVLALNSSASRTIIEQQLSSAEGMARNIGQNVIKNIWWSVPSLETQREVVSYLKRASAPIQSAEAKIQQSLARLDELRSSLITAAVTGKIDPATWGRRGMTERALASVGELS
jgi:type I restriction enzyme S subunit